MRKLDLLGVPLAAGTHGPGQERAPAHLRAAGLAGLLTARGVEVRDHGDTPEVAFGTDPGNPRQQNLGRVAEVARTVAGRVSDLLRADDGVPLILGGDCTITLGVLAAYVARYPDLGLLYFDGDIDVSTPATTTSVFCRHEAFGGLVITEVNPNRDPGGALAARLAEDVAEALS